jgi:photosynthetic reaction center cytochrome c subunit
VIVRNLGRVSIAAMTAVLLLMVAARTGVSAQQPPQGPAQGAQQPPGPGGGRGGPQPPKNIQVLKDVPVDQLMLTMQYIAASLGVQCTYCHVQGQNDLDDKDTKKRAREMMKMVQDINGKFFDGTQRLSCASCHNGRPKPLRTPPLAVHMTPAEAAAAAAGRGRGRGGPGGPGGGAPAAPGAQEGRAEPGVPVAEGRGGPGRGAGPQEPPEPTETVDEVIAKYVQALGGQPALQNATTRVMTGTVTSRDLVTSNVTVQEKSTGEYRIDIATQPIPTIRAFNGKTAWAVGGGGGGRGAAPDAPRDLAAFQMQQGLRLADFTLPLRLKDRYTNLLVNKAYETIDTKPVVVITGRVAPNVTEQLSFDRASGLLLRRLIITTGERLMNLPEQIDYSDYREVSGVKVPFTVRHATWNAVTTQRFADVKINAPVDDAVFGKPAPKP